MILFLIAFIAGALTVLAPCILPLLPIIVGGSVSGGQNRRRAYTVVLSLGISVILFTLILKFSTALIGVPPYAWQWFSGTVLFAFGAVTLFPRLWDSLSFVGTLNRESNKVMSAGFMRQSFWGDVLVGAALGPVFSTCSPTYFVILATVLPASFWMGLADLIAYAVGLMLALLLVALLGQKLVDRLGVAADPNGWFKRGIGALFILVGVLVFTGAQQPIQVWLADHVYDVTMLERSLLEAKQDGGGLSCRDGRCLGPNSTSTDALISASQKAMRFPMAPELTKVAGYINTGGKPITLAQYRGDKVVLIDIWTYSCINCQRTFPYLKKWYEKYKDQGLEIVGVHTPEFAFERVQMNVENAMRGYGLTWPTILDNDYGTWNAFENNYWPRKYLIDIDGFIVYDHAGEGDYEETEKAIQVALAERAKRLGGQLPTAEPEAPMDVIPVDFSQVGSPEIYFGSERNEYFGSASPGISGVQTFSRPEKYLGNTLYFSGTWDITPEYSASVKKSGFYFQYRSKDVYIVAGSDTSTRIEVLRDGKPLEQEFAGSDIVFEDGRSYLEIGANTLYKVIEDDAYESHLLEFQVTGPGVQVYTFTFG